MERTNAVQSEPSPAWPTRGPDEVAKVAASSSADDKSGSAKRGGRFTFS